MAAPTISFLYNSSGTDTVYTGSGAADANFDVININNDKLIFTGGGIDDSILTTPTCASGTRSPTIRPSVGSYVIPETYVEDSSLMTHIPLVEYNPNANRYCMAIYVNGTASSIIYLEAWDSSDLSTTNLEVLQGSAASGNESYVNAITTTNGAPDLAWTGGSANAAYLRGTGDRIALDTSSPITDKTLYYSIYIRLYDDSVTFHNTPVLAARYLYT